MTGGSTGAKRPGGFVLGKRVPQAPPKKAPKAAALTMDDGLLPPPSPATLALFEKPCDLWVAVDVETHELIPNTKDYSGWISGQFGHLCRTSEESISELRVVQLGYCVGGFSSRDPPRSVQLLVRPDGFAISPMATEKHRITDERAKSEGVSLAVALEQMLGDIFSVARRGGRICAHQSPEHQSIARDIPRAQAS